MPVSVRQSGVMVPVGEDHKCFYAQVRQWIESLEKEKETSILNSEETFVGDYH